MKKKVRLRGLKKIHFARIEDSGEFATPIHLTGAKKFESSLNYELEQRESDDIIDEQSYIFQGGEGTLTLKSLTPMEYTEMFGHTTNDGLVVVRTTDIAPQGAILFERAFSGSNHKRLYCVFNCKFAPTGISAESMGMGTVEIDEELTFSVGEYEDNLVYVTLDTDSTVQGHKALADKWFTEVITLEEIKTASLPVQSVAKLKEEIKK